MGHVSEDYVEQWGRRLALLSSDMLELAEMDTYRLLTGSDNFERIILLGASKPLMESIFNNASLMWQSLGILTDQIDRAQAVRASVKRWHVADKYVIELERLLVSASVELSIDCARALKLYDSINPVDGALVVTVDQLCTALKDLFKEFRDQVLTIDTLWSNLPKMLSSLDSEVQQLEQLARDLAEDCGSQIDTVRKILDDLKEKVKCDPIGCRESIETAANSLILATRNRLEEIEYKRAQLRADIRRCDQTLDRLKEIRSESQAAYLKAGEKIEGPNGLIVPISLDEVEDLQSWLRKLEEAIQNGFWKPALVGLQRWRTTSDKALRRAQYTLSANCAPLQERDELRGRLSALMAQSEARTKSGAIDANNSQLLKATGAEAKRILYAPCTSLTAAAALVSKYQTLLSEAINSSVHEDSK